MEKNGLLTEMIQGVKSIAYGRMGLQSPGNEPFAARSAESAVRKFEDALLAFKAVQEGAAYHIAEMTFPHDRGHRYKSLPKDSFHIACIADSTRIRNGLTRLGISEADKNIANARWALLADAQESYAAMQKAALKE